ncbi:hypothetical protein O181_065194 [Austropuccinia psidii MF-1]|uniref:Uncharacterized protein n=1 Tax=Austropuccinia psidii MF-1 TaxID=1389203 RepID=A0A9Q3EQL4_9BASI|nr:hypothetical protein [Austropuccinia psidii MF-1]
MPIQHSPPERQTRSQAGAQAVLTPNPRAPLDSTPEGPSEDGEEEEENFVEEEESEGTEGVPAPVGEPQSTGGPNLAQSNQPVSHPSEPSLLIIMHKMTQIMATLKADSSFKVSRPPAFKTPSRKAPECFDGLTPSKLEALFSIVNESFKIIWKITLITERKFFMPLHFLLARLQNGLSLIFTILPIKTKGSFLILGLYLNHNSLLYLGTQMKSLVSRIGDWGERGLIHHCRKGLPSRILDQLASHPSRIDSLQDLMDITLELDTRYNERQKEKNHHQEKNPEASKSNSSYPQISSSSKQKKKKNFQKRDKPHSSLLNEYFKLMNSEKERRIKEGLCTYCGGKHILESCLKRP